MNKKLISGVLLSFFGIILFFGSFKMLPDIKPMGASSAVIFLGLSLIISHYLKKKWNKKMVLGMVFFLLGLVSVFATVEKLPDVKPLITMVFLSVAGMSLFLLGGVRASKEETVKTADYFNFLGWVVVALLLFISFILFPQINWQHPKDPAAVMTLTFISAIFLAYALVKNHRAKKSMVIAGSIAIFNFCLIPLYEKGIFNFIGKFFRLFIPFYQKLDPQAETIEWVLIVITVFLLIGQSFFMMRKKIHLSDYGNITLLYFLIQPLMAIFLFEMMGLPAGFLAGQTTRSDLLVTDTNAVMSTFGMIFIAVPVYLAFQIFPFWMPPILAGLWWILWKPWFLHHPNPQSFTSFQVFWPAAKFLFFTGLKRMVLPMILLLGFLNFLKKSKKKNSL